MNGLDLRHGQDLQLPQIFQSDGAKGTRFFCSARITKPLLSTASYPRVRVPSGPLEARSYPEKILCYGFADL